MYDTLLSLALAGLAATALLGATRLLQGPAASRRATLGRVAICTILALAVTGVVLYRLMNSRSIQLAGSLVTRVESADKVVALTFDDGPTSRTSEVLGILDDEGVPATFFVTGAEATERPRDLVAIVEAGHQVGNHTWSHRPLIFTSDAEIAAQFERTDAAIRAAGYRGEILVRTPFGKRLLDAPLYFARTGRTNVLWDSEADSAKGVANDAGAIVETTLADVQPGSIVLMHVMYDSRESSREALPRIIRALRERGYRFVTLGELLDAESDGATLRSSWSRTNGEP